MELRIGEEVYSHCKKHHHVSTSEPLHRQGILRFIQFLLFSTLIAFLSCSTCRPSWLHSFTALRLLQTTWQLANHVRLNRSCTPPPPEHHSSSATCRKHIATAPDPAAHDPACLVFQEKILRHAGRDRRKHSPPKSYLGHVTTHLNPHFCTVTASNFVVTALISAQL